MEKTGIDLYTEQKQQLKDMETWIVVDERKNQLILQDSTDEEGVYTFSYLENETNHIHQLKPDLSLAYITRYWCDEQYDRTDEIELHGRITGYQFMLRADMHQFMESNEGVFVRLAVKDTATGENLFRNMIPEHVKAYAKELYTAFKQVIMDSPLFRLQFVTHQIGFNDIFFNMHFEQLKRRK